MKKLFTFFGLTLSIFSSGFGGEIPSVIKVDSPSFKNGDFIPQKYTCDGEDVSPALSWSNFPKETKSFVIIMDDPDAPIGTFTHWIVYDIPVSTTSLPENFPKVAEIDGIKQGINDFRRIGYGGPCPPPGKPHRYFFKIYALNVASLNVEPGATRKQVERSMENHILAKGTLMGKYGR